MNCNFDVILASSSPRRRELLELLGFQDFRIIPAKGGEHPPHVTDPAEIVRQLASAKAREVAEQAAEDALIIAADTIVWLEGSMLGKPHSEEEACSMLRRLSRREHEVYTGVSLIRRGTETCEAECTSVRFRELSDEEIRRYVACGEPMDKAGAYAVQGKGALFVEHIDGDFFNVMGLPLCRLGKMLGKRGVSIL